jgi:PAS domain S-box-containing protein
MWVDAEGRCLGLNRAGTRILGMDRESLGSCRLPEPWSGLSADDGAVLAPEDFPGLVVLRTGRPVAPKILRWRREAGSILWMEVSADPLEGGGALVSFKDITEHRDQSRKLERLTELYAALSQVNQAIVWASTREALLDRICEVMVAFGKFAMAWIGWNDPATHDVRVVSKYGDQYGYLERVRVRSDDTPLGHGGTGTAIREARTCVVNDFLGSSQASPWHEAARRSGFAASVSIPFRFHGEVCGALVAYATEKDYFGAEEIKLLEEAAGDVTFALAHLELDAERKAVEQALLKSERFLCDAQSAAGVGCFSLDINLGIWESSRTFDAIFGIAPDYPRDIAGWLDLVAPHAREEHLHQLQDLIHGKGPFQLEFQFQNKHDGQEQWASGKGSLELDSSGQTTRIIGTMLDITERKQAEARLRESEETYHSILDASPDGILFTSLDGRILMVSPAANTLFGYQPEECIGLQILDFLVEDELDRAQANIRSICQDGRRIPSEYRAIRKDKHIIDVEINGSAIFDAGNHPIKMVFVLRDITERKQSLRALQDSESRLQQAQKMESLGILAGGVAHDMNNVLAAILGLASANFEAQPAGSPVRSAFETILKAAERGGTMVQSLLRFARQSPTEVRQLDLNALLREEVHLLEHITLYKIHLEMDLVPDLRPMLGDANALTNVFMNLCVNAVDAMPSNGTLTFRTRNLEHDWIEVQVEDNGTGMSREILEKALDPFFTTKMPGKGTGLGLSMVYSTVKAHHGHLDIQSQPGQGTCVRMQFPAVAPSPAAAGPIAEPMPVGVHQALSILLVDDDDLVQQSIQAVLDMMGHRATIVSSGEDALTVLKSGCNPDAVILDMNMPGLGGAETLPRLRELRPAVPVLLATGRVDQAALDLVGKDPHVTLLSKPFSMMDLQRQLASHGLGSS